MTAKTDPATAARTFKVPKDWHEVKQVSSEIRKIQNEDINDVSLVLASGRKVSLPVDVFGDETVEMVKKGYLKLYRNDRDSSEPTDEGGDQWFKADYLVAQPSMKELDGQLEKFLSRADRISKAANTEFDKMHEVMHAARVIDHPDQQEQIEREVAAELPKAGKAIFQYEQDVAELESDEQLLRYPSDAYHLSQLGRAALRAGAPHVDGSLGNLTFAKNLLRANKMLLSRPDVTYVDPGFGIRIGLDAQKIVNGGGDVGKVMNEITGQLRDDFITDALDFDRNGAEQGASAAGQKVLEDALGEGAISQIGTGNNNLTLYVHKGFLAEAKKHQAELNDIFSRYGYDMSTFKVQLDETSF